MPDMRSGPHRSSDAARKKYTAGYELGLRQLPVRAQVIEYTPGVGVKWDDQAGSVKVVGADVVQHALRGRVHGQGRLGCRQDGIVRPHVVENALCRRVYERGRRVMSCART